MSATDAARFGAMLRESRRSLGLSQAELGGGKYSGSYISHLESGRRVANAEAIEFLSRRLGVSLLEWGVTATGDSPAQAVVADAIEDLLVAERASSQHDWAAATAHATKAAEIAFAAGDMSRHWESLYVLAQTRHASGEFLEAAHLAEQLSEHETALKFGVARAQALSLASIGYRASDRLGWAVAFGARAVEAASSAPPVILSEALMALVSAMSEAGHSAAESEPYLRRLHELSPRLNSSHSRGIIAWTVGVAAFVAGDQEAGLRYFEEAKHLLEPQRDLRMWFRYHSIAARWRLNTGLLDGVESMIQTASTGLAFLGNTYDLVELRQVEAMLALRKGDAVEAARLMSEVLDDPVMGADGMSRGGSELLLAHAFEALGRNESARRRYQLAAMQFEVEGRFRAAVDAWRRSAGEETSNSFLTQG
ncbi:MAG TPA: helix-turn-helix transcriptional regulator [Propionicimonas sp.]|nr:helix-turn-helix transcriptional regulator [Propionicimonas sp.]HQD97804.1 helix-turn-helix transcriptional regulator [Propionicimonas sp.]